MENRQNKYQWRTAIHEAGHAAAIIALTCDPYQVEVITIEPQKAYNPEEWEEATTRLQRGINGFTRQKPTYKVPYKRAAPKYALDLLTNVLVIAYAGAIAEVICGIYTKPNWAILGRNAADLCNADREIKEAGAEKFYNEIVRYARSITRYLLTPRRRFIEALAAALMERGTLTGEDIEPIFDQYWEASTTDTPPASSEESK